MYKTLLKETTWIGQGIAGSETACELDGEERGRQAGGATASPLFKGEEEGRSFLVTGLLFMFFCFEEQEKVK